MEQERSYEIFCYLLTRNARKPCVLLSFGETLCANTLMRLSPCIYITVDVNTGAYSIKVVDEGAVWKMNKQQISANFANTSVSCIFLQLHFPSYFVTYLCRGVCNSMWKKSQLLQQMTNYNMIFVNF